MLLDLPYADVSAQPVVGVRTSVDIERECRTFTRYLVHGDADGYVIEKYAGYQTTVVRHGAASPFDDALVRFAAGSPLRARIADAYGRVFHPQCTLRRKLILMTAILENAPAYHRMFAAGSAVGFFAAARLITTTLMAFVFALAAGVVILGPVQLLAHAGRVQRPAL